MKVPTFFEAEVTPVDLLVFMIENINDVNWRALSDQQDEDHVKLIQSLHESILHAIEKLKRVRRKKGDDVQFALSTLVKERLEKHKLFIPSGIYHLMGGAGKKSGHVRIPHMKEVARLAAEQSFGELALMTNQPRSASAICATDSYFGVIEKEDF